jgi:plasmid stabilization system protein ParE
MDGAGGRRAAGAYADSKGGGALGARASGETSRLGEEFARALELLAVFPDLGIGVGRRGRRRLLLPDVGYHIYYVHRAARVEIVAVWYARRGQTPR